MRTMHSQRWPLVTFLNWSAFIGLVCVAATACGLQNSPHGTRSHLGSGSVATCTTAQLNMTLDVRSVGVAAGTTLIPLDFTNVARTSCTLAGYAFVTFVTSRAGGTVGAAATADRQVAARTLLLRGGQSAHLWLRLLEAANLPTSTCRPKAVAGLNVRLPGQDSATFIAHQFTTCSRHVVGMDLLAVEPFQAGRARIGTAQ